MKWTITTAPTANALTFAQVQTHLRLPSEDDREYIEDTVIPDAVDIAEQEMQCSLTPRTITATFYDGELPERLILPRGPVTAITSVTAGGSTVASGSYELRTVGNTDYLHLLTSVSTPLVVVYTAGYATLPAKFRRLLLNDCGSLYLNRESVNDSSVKALPQSSQRIYELNRRGSLVG